MNGHAEELKAALDDLMQASGARAKESAYSICLGLVPAVQREAREQALEEAKAEATRLRNAWRSAVGTTNHYRVDAAEIIIGRLEALKAQEVA